MKRRTVHPHSPLRNYAKRIPKLYHLITLLMIGDLDHYKNKIPLTIISILHYIWCGIPSFRSKQLSYTPKHDQNKWPGGVTPLLGWPQLPDDSVFLSSRLWFQKRKTTRLRKDKSFSVCFRKSKRNKIHVGGFWRELLICLSGMGLWVLPIFLLDCWSFALQHDSKPSP